MDPTLQAVLQSWPSEPGLVLALLLTAWVYLRGWRRLRRRGYRRLLVHHLLAFLGGLAGIFLALASPIDPFGALLLQVHMVQHLLLMMVVPPLLWLGAPVLPLLAGLPQTIRRHWLDPFLRLPALRRAAEWLTTLPVAWVLFVVSTWLWHAPPMYELALRSPNWHRIEHACFLGTALLFWRPIILFPGRSAGTGWALLPYLFLADVQNTILSALLAFSDRLLYPHYAAVPRLGGMSAVEDQAAAGVFMWVPGSIAFLVPLAWIGARLLYGPSRLRATALGGERRGVSPPVQVPPAGLRRAARLGIPRPGRISLPLVSPTKPATVPWDLLRVPLLGRFLRWRSARPVLQAITFGVAVLVILDGLLGPQLAPMNLAGVLPWIHWRGLVVLGLLVGGNFFCLACPFTLPRTLARRWLPAPWQWPRPLRGKWLAATLLVLFFTAYETFALWDSPWRTACIALGYFLAAFVLDGCFQGATFCKYVCPIGQFQFVQSLLSPLEVRVRDAAVCRTCTTRDCIRGNAAGPGCELHLYQPRKAGNMDCTFCLDCVHACPHDNVGILASTPGHDLLHDPQRSGLGRFSRRPDLAALVLVLVFAAFVNAAGMIAPVVDSEVWLTSRLGLASGAWVKTATVLIGLLLLPPLLMGAAALLGRWWSGDTSRPLLVATRYAYALVPLGCGMWLAHYSFHFLTSAGTLLPVVQRLAGDVGVSWLGEPVWRCSCCTPALPWLLPLQIVFLDLGLLVSLYAGYHLTRQRWPGLSQRLRAFAPWAVLMVLLFVVGVWVLFQPMEMRGTL